MTTTTWILLGVVIFQQILLSIALAELKGKRRG